MDKGSEGFIAAVNATREIAAMTAVLGWVTICIGVIILIGIIVVIVMLGQIAKKVLGCLSQIAAHTNGMHTELIIATRKLGVMEGEALGRAAQRLEDERLAKQEEKS